MEPTAAVTVTSASDDAPVAPATVEEPNDAVPVHPAPEPNGDEPSPPEVSLAPVAGVEAARDQTLEIPAEFILVGTVPRSSVFAADAAAVWEYEPEHDASGGIIEMRSKPAATDVLASSPVDTERLTVALRDCAAHIEHNVMGSLLFKYMFRVPHHDVVVSADAASDSGDDKDNKKVTRQAFACFVSPKGQPLPFMGTKDGKVTIYVARDPLVEGKVIAPGNPGGATEDKPMVLAIDPEITLADSVTGIDASNICVVDPAADEQRTLVIFSVSLDKGIDDMTILFRGQSVVPTDNSGKPFRICDDDNALSLPEEAAQLVSLSKAEPASGEDKAGSTATTHMGKCMLRVASYYFASKADTESVFHDDEQAADNVTARIASTLATMLQNNHGVRDAIVRQLYRKVGPHMFPVGDAMNMQAALQAAKPDDDITLTVNMDHNYRVGIRGKDDDATRSVSLKRITVVLKLGAA